MPSSPSDALSDPTDSTTSGSDELPVDPHLTNMSCTLEDPLTEVVRAGARQLVRHAVEAEVAALLAAYADHRTETGRRRLVRHGHGPEREILTGIGAVPVRRPKVRDRGGEGEDRIRFSSTMLPRFARRTRSLDAALPTLYLLGVSSGDFGEALSELVGSGASGLSPGVIGRLKSAWEAEHERWRLRGSLEPTVCLRLGGRDLPSGSIGRREAVRSGVDRCDAGGPEGTAGVPGGVPGERSELAGTPGGSEGTWPHDPPGTGDRGRGSRLLEGAGRELPKDAPPALLGAQDRERAERVAEGPAAEREAGPAPDLDGGGPRRGGEGHGYLRRQIPGQVSEGGHLPDQGPGGVARVLRLPGRALAAHPDHETPSRACSRRSGIAPFAARDASPTTRRWRWSSSW